MFQLIYDLLVYLTNNYSKMPADFKKRFSETFLIRSRIDIGSINASLQNYSDYE